MAPTVGPLGSLRGRCPALFRLLAALVLSGFLLLSSAFSASPGNAAIPTAGAQLPQPAPAQPAPRPEEPTRAAAQVAPPAVGVFDAAVEQAALDLVNRSRAQFGLAPLAMDETLRQVARDHAQDMGMRDYFAHVTPEGRSPFDRMREAGITYRVAGENLGMSQGLSTLEGVQANHEAMMAETPPEDGHRVNLLNGAFQKAGIGVFRTPQGRVYYVCDLTG